MIVKYIAALGYTASWGIVALSVYRPVQATIWVTALLLAVVGTLSAWNALPEPSRKTAKDEEDGDSVPLKSVKP